MINKAEVRLLPRAVEDLKNIGAYWRHNIAKEEANKIILQILKDLKELALFYPAADDIRYEILKRHSFKIFRSGAYICICKKIENVIYIYHIAHADTEYPDIFNKK